MKENVERGLYPISYTPSEAVRELRLIEKSIESFLASYSTNAPEEPEEADEPELSPAPEELDEVEE